MDATAITASPSPARVPPHAFFLVSAVFHYLGPSFAVLLFARVAPLGVAWLRIASAAVVFGVWRRPWRYARDLSPADRRVVLGLGVVLALMNSCFYLAIDRLPLSTVGAIEFLGPIGLATEGCGRGAMPPRWRSPPPACSC
ncbi:MAG: EamA family transporter [Acetobacteraceae bacterium]